MLCNDPDNWEKKAWIIGVKKNIWFFSMDI